MDRSGSTLSDLPAAKAEWRRRLRVRLAAMTDDARVVQSRAICERVVANDVFHTARVVLLYAPMATEVDVTMLWRDAETRGCQTYFPRVVGADQALRFVRVTADSEWCKTMQPFRQPRSKEVVTAREMAEAVIVVPGLGFACSGGRLGRGGGFYDRSLAAPPLSGRGYRIGVAFAEQMVDDLAVGPFDVPMHAVVSAEGTWVTGFPLGRAT
ncbi:MAG: 5-formyltetrahydrofolate cyclo-ligase [Deltaproteobacteria bacterium]|nr:5-formyltetrahydrofolate cyclo-ligase [Deltaproteobacteria bacterium]MBI3386276.1 5-formyltetrahydrofolate cyclo-ligase [Deltaproteobacteria bacterium]